MGVMNTNEQHESQQQTTNGNDSKKLTILHYNDVYNIDTQGT